MRIVMFRDKWHVIIGAGKSARRISLRTTDRELAERRVTEYRRGEAEIAGGSVGAIYEAYISDRKAQGKSVTTAEFSWRALKPLFAGLAPAQITREVCRRYTEARRADGIADGTIIRDLGVVRSALRWADKNTPAVFETPSAPPAREIHITKDEFLALRKAAARTPHLKVFVELAKATGARAGAILELRWLQVDFGHGFVNFNTTRDTGNKTRAVIPMVESLRSVLREAKAAALTPHVVEYKGAGVRSIKNAFNRAAAEAGRPDIGPHTIRHSVAVWMAEAGRPMAEIAQYLGHKDSRITERVYARFSPSHLRETASVLDF